MRIFASELSKCRKIKFLYGVLLSVASLVIFIVFPLIWVASAPVEKTDEDFVYEYVMKRFNYTPDTVKNALFNNLQYVFPLYSEVIKEELEYVRNLHIYQQFIPERLKERENIFLVEGHIVQVSCRKKGCEKVLDEKGTIKIKEIKEKRNRRFVVEEKSW